MSYLRSTGLRRLVAIMFLIAGLSVQVQTLFACNLMDDAPKTECCCGEHMEKGCAMGGGCHSPAGSSATDCCDVTVNVEMQDASVTATTYAKLVTQLDALQPPPAIFASTSLAIPPPQLVNTFFDLHSPPSWSPGTHTYLMTNRFRI